MANKLDNLMSVEELNSRRTPEQHSADSRKAGIASGKARQEKATMKKALEMLLDEQNKKSGKTYRELATLGLIQGAIKGNALNYKTILEVMGETNLTDDNNINKNILNIADLINNPVKNRTEKDVENVDKVVDN